MQESDPISQIERKIQVLLVENKISVAKLCEEIGMTSNGYHKMWKNRSLKVETMQKIAKFFSVPLDSFFTTSNSPGYLINDPSSSVEEIREKYIQALESENKLLKQLLNEKDK